MTHVPVSQALLDMSAGLPPGASAFLSLDTRLQQFQVVCACDGIAFDFVRIDGSDGPALIGIWDTRRLKLLLEQAIKACNRVIDPRQAELWPDQEVA